ncbi:MAG: hypothetical protein ACXWC9_06215, partial [Pseudobdellovibrionaceae bacterium]
VMDPRFVRWIELAKTAPSGDNAQPWLVTLLDGKFRLAIDPAKLGHFLDQNESASWIALGCFYENLFLSAAHFGFECSFTHETDQSVIVTYRSIEEKHDFSLIQAIRTRQTYRVPLKKTDFDLVQAYHNRFQKIKNHTDFEWQRIRAVSFRRIFQWSWLETQLWLKTSLMADFVVWLRLNIKNAVDGISLPNLRVGLSENLSLRIFKHFPKLIHWMPVPLFLVQTLIRNRGLVKNSAGLLYLTGHFKNHRDHFEAGREIQRMWILMTENNIQAQPITIPSLYLNFIDSKKTQSALPPQTLAKFEKIKQETQSELKVHNDLIFMFRYGTTPVRIAPLPRHSIFPIAAPLRSAFSKKEKIAADSSKMTCENPGSSA